MAWWWQHASPANDPRYYPAPVPSAGVFDEPTVCIKVNQEWVAHIDGLLGRLSERDAWFGTDSEVDFAVQEVAALLAHLTQDCG